MTSTITVPVAARLRLGHACLQHLADGAGARVLHIKGVALHPLLAAGRAASSDCDVLVRPADVPAYLAALVGAGWELITHFEHGSVFEHAATYYHPVWGTVDVHRTFPGIDRDPSAAFAELWDHRALGELGGHDCAVPDLRAQRLLLLVHATRDAMGRREHDLAVSWEQADDAERAAIDDLADRLGARVPLALITGRPERAAGEPHLRTWQAAFDGSSATDMWRARLQDARGLARLRLLLRAARLNPDHLALRLGHAPSAEERRSEWWDRWRRGWRGLRARSRARRAGSSEQRPTEQAPSSDRQPS